MRDGEEKAHRSTQGDVLVQSTSKSGGVVPAAFRGDFPSSEGDELSPAVPSTALDADVLLVPCCYR